MKIVLIVILVLAILLIIDMYNEFEWKSKDGLYRNNRIEFFFPKYAQAEEINSYCAHLSHNCCSNPYDCDACQRGIYYRRW